MRPFSHFPRLRKLNQSIWAIEMCRFSRPKKLIYAVSDFPLVFSPGRWYMRAKAETSGCVYVFVCGCAMWVCVSEREKRQTAALGVNMMLLVLHTQTTPWPTFHPIPHTPTHSHVHKCMHAHTHLHISPSLFLSSALHPFQPPSQTHHLSSSTAPHLSS